MFRDFNTPLSSVDRSSRQKINKETVALNDTLDQIDLIDIFRAFHHKATEYTYFSSTYGMFFLGQTMWQDTKQVSINLRKFKSYQASLTTVLWNYKSNKKKTEKQAKMWKLNNMLLNNEWFNKEVKEEIKR